MGKFVVVGGSVGGLEAAIRLSEIGEVILYEEHSEIGKPVQCGEGWVRFTGVEPYIHGISIERADIYLLDRDYSINYKTTLKVNGLVEIVDRAEIEKKMASIAKKNGAEIHTGVRIKSLSELIKQHKDCDLIVDASGYPSLWNREFGGKKEYAPAIQMFSKKNVDRLAVFFHPDLDGYFWIFPRVGGGSKVGVGSFDKKPIKPLRVMLDEFLSKVEVAKGHEPMSERAYTARPVACYLNSPFLRQLDGVPVALVGDAAGIVDRCGGEGITKAIISARVLAECVKSGSLSGYERAYLRKMASHYRLMSALRYVWRHPRLLKILGKIRAFDVLQVFL